MYSEQIITGYKGFKIDENGLISCNNLFFSSDGSWNKHDGDVKMCTSGFHYCKNIKDVFSYYEVSNGNIFAQVEVEEGIYDQLKKKGVTAKLRIVSFFTGIISTDQVQKYFFNGLPHRENGPAIEYRNHKKEWWINGKLHREDGPAIEYANGDKEWWINGKLQSKDGKAGRLMQLKNAMAMADVCNGLKWNSSEYDQFGMMTNPEYDQFGMITNPELLKFLNTEPPCNVNYNFYYNKSTQVN